MNAEHIKGAFLEYLVRQLLKNSGFSNVRADGLFTYEQGGLFYIHGKGAAHDADVIMNPPIQLPFFYPIQLIFECKAYSRPVGMTIIRNALGFRNDINEFEIVTRDILLERQNNHRSQYAIDTRKRFSYQIGIAACNDFSKNAFEFAANNKIPLLSLSWFLNEEDIYEFNNIAQTLNSYDHDTIQRLYDFFKDREDRSASSYGVYDILNSQNVFGRINSKISNLLVGLLATGDMIFLSPIPPDSPDSVSSEFLYFPVLDGERILAQIHFYNRSPKMWELSVQDAFSESKEVTKFYFFLPPPIYEHWKMCGLNPTDALSIKEKYMSKILVFNKLSYSKPFSIITLDNDWFLSVGGGNLHPD